MRVAVVSSDGKVINQHFGRASRFLIFEIDSKEIRLIEVRETLPLCGSADYGNTDEVMSKTISLIKDCEALLCARIGNQPKEKLQKNGIKPIEAPYFIHEALKKLKN